MLSYLWPLALILVANTAYNICAKSIPAQANTLVSLIVTYLVSAGICLAAYLCTAKGTDFAAEIRHLNWTAPVLGLSIVCLEAGFIYAYKAGWPVSTLFIVMSALLALILLAVGYALYREAVTPSKIAGITICLVGLYFLSR